MYEIKELKSISELRELYLTLAVTFTRISTSKENINFIYEKLKKELNLKENCTFKIYRGKLFNELTKPVDGWGYGKDDWFISIDSDEFCLDKNELDLKINSFGAVWFNNIVDSVKST